MSELSSSIEEIMKDVEVFLGERFRDRKECISKTLESIANLSFDFDAKVEVAGLALQKFWKEYSREHISKVLERFPKLQKALLGLELEPELGERYRDHYLHMFNIFVFGARIMAKIFKLAKRDEILRKLFKVTEEPKEIRALFEKGEYTPSERFNFLWTLISTFHDVGIPIEHLPSFQKGLNSFFNHFGLGISEFSVEREVSVDCRLQYYIDLMARMYNDGITLTSDGKYAKTDTANPYVMKALMDEYSGNSHGVMSAICLYKSIEETFYKGKKGEERPDFDLEETLIYDQLVFEQDITRAALVIALHDIDFETYTKLIPISFIEFPFLYLLILCDELQEYFRLEGSSMMGVTLIKSFPFLEVKADENSGAMQIHVKILVTRPSTREEDAIKKEVLPYYEKIDETPPRDFSEHISKIFGRIVKRLEKRLKLKGEPIEIELEVYEDNASNRILHWKSVGKKWH